MFGIGRSSKPMCTLTPKGRNVSNAFVRQCAFSDDGSIIVAVDDASCVTQYDRVASARSCKD